MAAVTSKAALPQPISVSYTHLRAHETLRQRYLEQFCRKFQHQSKYFDFIERIQSHLSNSIHNQFIQSRNADPGIHQQVPLSWQRWDFGHHHTEFKRHGTNEFWTYKFNDFRQFLYRVELQQYELRFISSRILI